MGGDLDHVIEDRRRRDVGPGTRPAVKDGADLRSAQLDAVRFVLDMRQSMAEWHETGADERRDVGAVDFRKRQWADRVAEALCGGDIERLERGEVGTLDRVGLDAGEADAAFFLRPTPVAQVRAVADEGETMPPKSTYFFPKLLTGIVFNPLSSEAPGR